MGNLSISKNVTCLLGNTESSIFCLGLAWVLSERSLAFRCIVEIYFFFTVISGSYCSSTSSSNAVF